MTAEFGRFSSLEQALAELKPLVEKIKAKRVLTNGEFYDLVANILGMSALGISTSNIADTYVAIPEPKKKSKKKGAYVGPVV